MLQQYSATDETHIMILSRHFVQYNYIFIFSNLNESCTSRIKMKENVQFCSAEFVPVCFFLIFNEIFILSTFWLFESYVI